MQSFVYHKTVVGQGKIKKSKIVKQLIKKK